MFSIPTIICDSQNILLNNYIKQEHAIIQKHKIKQEHIVDTTEYKLDCGGNDSQSTFQCYMKDSMHTTDEFEIDIINGNIYESFFMKDNNYVPSIVSGIYDIKLDTDNNSINSNHNNSSSTTNLSTTNQKVITSKNKNVKIDVCFKSATYVAKPYKCNICNKSFSQKGNMMVHIRVHTREKPYKCFICNKTFTQASTLITHKVIHNADKPFNCNICKKTFAQKVNMKTHIIMVHSGEDPYKVVSGTKLYSQNISTTVLNTQTNIINAEKQYKCDDCSKWFSCKANFKTHTKIHKGERPYKCNICNRPFSQKGNMINHIRIHQGESPYKCHVCNRSFSQKGNMITHIRIHKGEGPYKCNICNKSFSQKGNMKTHIKIHTREETIHL